MIESLIIGEAELAHYPFLDESREYLKDFDWKVFNDPAYEGIVDRAIRRVRESTNGIVDKEVGNYKTELLTFLASLVILKVINMQSLDKKYAMTEARRVQMLLLQDTKADAGPNAKRLVRKIMQDVASIPVSISMVQDGRGAKMLFSVKIKDYLERTAELSSGNWRLVNRLVSAGNVYLDTDEAIRLVRDELAQKIVSKVQGIKIPEDRQVIRMLSDKALKLKAEIEPALRPKTASVFTGAYPPCVSETIKRLEDGQNVPHHARVLLATYMTAIGRSVEEVCEFFKNAPDYNEGITKYQVEQLAGLKGSGIKYSIPGCENLQTKNWCFKNDACGTIINPIQFGRKKTT